MEELKYASAFHSVLSSRHTLVYLSRVTNHRGERPYTAGVPEWAGAMAARDQLTIDGSLRLAGEY